MFWYFSMSSKLKMAFIMNMGSRLVTKEKTGFTLAEVLITLGIIGVVAALAILKRWTSEPTLLRFDFISISHAELVSASQIKRISIFLYKRP